MHGRAPPGKGPQTKVVHVDTDLWEHLARLAELEERTMAWTVRAVLLKGLKQVSAEAQAETAKVGG